MKLEKFVEFSKKKKNGTYVSVKIARILGIGEVNGEYQGRVVKTTRMVARIGVRYGNIAEIKNRPADPNAQKRKPTNWFGSFENELSYAKDGHTILIWLTSTKNRLQGEYVEYTLDGKKVSKAELLSKGILKPRNDKEPLVRTVRLKDVTIG